jgi:hypothetical protein
MSPIFYFSKKEPKTMSNPVTPLPTQPDQIATMVNPPAQNPPAAPATPAAATSTAPEVPNVYASARPMNVPNPSSPALNDPHAEHVGMFDKILKMVNPGTSYVDANGQQQVIRNRASLGNSVIASVLAGMMTPTKYREGAYGPVVSGDATAADAYQAGKARQTEQNTKAQATSDEIQAKKLSVIKNNIDMVHQYAALAQQQHQELQGVADRNNATILKDLGDYDQTVTDPTQKLVLGKGLTYDQAMGMLKGKLSSQNAVIDGYQDVMDPDTHQMTVQPTFSVINPDSKIQMSESAAAELAKFKPAYKNAYALTGGNIRVPVGQYLSDLHTANTLSSAEGFMKRADAALGIDPTKVDFAGHAQKDPRVIQSVKDAENALAQGGSTADVLDRIQKSSNGSVLLDAMGLNGDKVQKYIDDFRNEQIKNASLAKEGGVGEKVPATQPQLEAYEASRRKLPADQQDEFEKASTTWTQGQLEKETARLDQRFSENTKNSIQAGDPAAIADQARLTIGAGDLTNAKDIFTARSNVKAAYNRGLENQAIALGLQPTHFNIEALKTKAAALDSYSAAGKVGQQLNAFKTFGEHVAGAKDANDAWQRSGSPLFNKPLSWLAENATNDQNYKRFQASVIAPMKEYMNFLNSSHAEHTEDIKSMQELLDSGTITPQSAYTVLQTLAKTADDRAKGLGETYRDTVGTTFPALISKATVDNFAKLGVKSQASALSGTLPRSQSWVSNLQPTTLNPANPQDAAIAKQFARAAGGDFQKATEMAKEHGWNVSYQ